MAEMYVGKKNAIPVRNTSNKWGEMIGNVSDQKDLQAELDKKVDKVATGNVIYGTDKLGNQTTYDASVLLGNAVSVPEEYTVLDSISSTADSYKITQTFTSIASYYSVSINRSALFNKLALIEQVVGYTVDRLRFQTVLDNHTVKVIAEDNEGNEEIYEQVSYDDSDWYTSYGMSWNPGKPTPSQDGDEMVIEITSRAGKQYIDTEIIIEDKPLEVELTESNIQSGDTLTITNFDVNKWANYKKEYTNTYNKNVMGYRVEDPNGTDAYTVVILFTDGTEQSLGNTYYGALYDMGVSVSSHDRTAGDYYVVEETAAEQIDTFEIDTQIKLAEPLDTEMSTDGAVFRVFGASNYMGNWGLSFTAQKNGANGFWKVGSYNTQIPYISGWNTFNVTRNNAKINKQLFSFIANTNRNLRSANTLWLFGNHYEPDHESESQNTCSGCSYKRTKITKNGELVRDYIPVLRNEDNTVGMYDLVSGNFYASQSSVGFVAGKEVEDADELSLGITDSNVVLATDSNGKTIAASAGDNITISGENIPEEYTRVEYVQTLASGPWFMLGHDYEYGNSYEAKFLINTLAESNPIFGCWNIPTSDNTAGGGIGISVQSNANVRTMTTTSEHKVQYDNIIVYKPDDWMVVKKDSIYGTYINGNLVHNLSMPSNYTQTGKPFGLFGINYGNRYFGEQTRGKIAYFKIYNSSKNLIANYVPVIRNTDGKIGFFEVYTQKFYQNYNEQYESYLLAGPECSTTISADNPYENDFVLSNAHPNIDVTLNLIEKHADLKQTNLTAGITDNTVIGARSWAADSTGYNTIIGAESHGINSNHSTIIGSASSATSAVNSVVVGSSASVSGSSSVAIGAFTSNIGSYAISIGVGNNQQAQNFIGGYASISMGYGARPYNGSYSVVIGYDAGTNTQNASESIAIGANTKYSASNAVAIGVNDANKAAGQNSIAIGYKANLNELYNCVAIGCEAGKANSGSYNDSIAIGKGAQFAGSYAVMIGNGQVSGGDTIGIGFSVYANTGSVAIGASSRAQVTDGIAIGRNAITTGQDSIVIGHSSQANDGAGYVKPDRTVVVGYNNSAIGSENVIIGHTNTIGLLNSSARLYNVVAGTNNSTYSNYSINIGYANYIPNDRDYSIVLGSGNQPTSTYTTTIGHGIKVEAEGAVALGNMYEVSNTEENKHSLFFGNDLRKVAYKVVDKDGLIPYERLSKAAPKNGYVLGYDEDSDSLVWKANSGSGGSDYELEPATKDTLGGIKVGNGLDITEDGTLSVKKGSTGGGSWGEIGGDIKDQEDLQEALDNKVTRLSIMPEATEDNTREVIQYIGDSNLLYTKGYFYESVYGKQPKITNIVVDSAGCTVDTNYESAQRFKQYFETYYNATLPTAMHQFTFVGSELKWEFEVCDRKIDDIVDTIYFTTAELQYLGLYVSYPSAVEPQNGDTIEVHYDDDSFFGYNWVRRDVQPLAKVVDTVDSTSVTDSLSANQGRKLQEQIDTLSAIGQFLAIWDCDTGIARFLNEGTEYTTGNYFIIGSVAEEGNDNYMPTGTSYTGASTTTTTDDVQVSDMYFFDGSQWILLANHARSIAVDAELSSTSTNPVENRKVKEELDKKLDKSSNTSIVYGTTAEGEQVTYTAGEGIEFRDGKINNTKEDVKWGNIDGSIVDQTDLTQYVEDYVAEHTPKNTDAMGTINLSSVFTRRSNIPLDEDTRYNYYGNFSDIFFTTNADIDYIKDNRNDLYVTFALTKRGQEGETRTYRIQNDRYVKTNSVMYCWRIKTKEHWEDQYQGWVQDYSNSDINYIYFYVPASYNTPNAIFNANPTVWVSQLRHEDGEDNVEHGGNWGACMNELEEWGRLRDLPLHYTPSSSDVERCEKFDIDRVVNVKGLDGAANMTKMHCRVYTDNNEKLYVWCQDWNEESSSVYAYVKTNEGGEFVLQSNKIPNFMGDLMDFFTVESLATSGYRLVEDRPDLNYYIVSNKQNTIKLAREYATEFYSNTGERDYNWGLYFWDYPIMPVRLSECKILMVDEAPYAPQDPDTEEYPNDKFNQYYGKGYTLDEIEADETLSELFGYQKQFIFQYPKNTAELWLRILGWQKLCYSHYSSTGYRQDYDYDYDAGQWQPQSYDEDGNVTVFDVENQAGSWDRHNLVEGIYKCGRYGQQTFPRYDEDKGGTVEVSCEVIAEGMGTMIGRKYAPNWNCGSDGSMYWLPVQFNLATGSDIAHNRVSKSTVVNKKLTITGSSYQNLM